MTYWYETPDDQKDTWHWMGVAISLAHTIGLHRNPATSNEPPRRQQLRKRIWLSCFMRDRLVALGMRRPTRVKDGDFDVPMLEERDFEIQVLSKDITVLPADCELIRDVRLQQQLAEMCVQKAKLCVLISLMLTRYTVLARDLARPADTTVSTMMLFPDRTVDGARDVDLVDARLEAWLHALPPSCLYRPLTAEDEKGGRATVAVHRNLLHMVYYTTVSALHRPQFLPAGSMQQPSTSREVQERSRYQVRESADLVTRMAVELQQRNLVGFLPTTGVTVVLPAMIAHMLDMKDPSPERRDTATGGFVQCMRVMGTLCQTYAAADFATRFMDAALRKAGIDITAAAGGGHNLGHKAALGRTTLGRGLNLGSAMAAQQVEELTTPPPENVPYITSAEMGLFHQGRSYAPKTGHDEPALPQMESDRDAMLGLTPSASGSSDADMDFSGADQFDWNQVDGANLNWDQGWDQYLQFPAEGVSNTDDALISILGGAEGNPGNANTTARSEAALLNGIEVES